MGREGGGERKERKKERRVDKDTNDIRLRETVTIILRETVTILIATTRIGQMLE